MKSPYHPLYYLQFIKYACVYSYYKVVALKDAALFHFFTQFYYLYILFVFTNGVDSP